MASAHGTPSKEPSESTLKIAIAQIDTTVGALRENVDKILRWIERARAEKADVVCFPELTLTGYPPLDLLHMGHFIEAQEREFKRVLEGSEGITVMVGRVESHTEAGKGLYNTAAIIRDGKILSSQRKRLLPTYDVFDEDRYFDPGEEFEPIELNGMRAGITVCEDIWNDKSFWPKRRYLQDPIEKIAENGIDILFNISGSPFHAGKPKQRLAMLRSIATRQKCWVIYANLVGGNDSLIFDGHSAVIGPDGEPRLFARGFDEDFLLFDLEQDSGPINVEHDPMPVEIYRGLVLGLRDYVRKCGFSRAIIGLSGGIDSSLTAAVAVDALGVENVRGVAMPSPYSSSHSVEDAFSLADNLGIRIDKVEIGPIYERFREQLKPLIGRGPGDDITLTEENLQARIRGNLLMALSNETGAIVLSTGNKSEMAVGYSTLYGDMSGGLSVIGDVPKTMVYEVARTANAEKIRIPERCFEKPPSAELRPDQRDEDSLPVYEKLDPILHLYIEENRGVDAIIAEGHDPEIVRKVVRMVDVNEYKRRQAAPVLRVTNRAFGMGRHMPIAQRYRQ